MKGWGLVSSHFINGNCRSMPNRLKGVIASDGEMVGY